ncbi:MAG: extracellular solute-binding protein [Anaerotignum sp.]|nr:extracellular solute-binding protein [Anaerotignum sp.]MBQ5709175.1 extracellular solute-binding protein [Anaerotignum sp.]
MKRFIALMMSLVMCAGLAACGGSDTSSDDTASVYYLNFKPEQDAQWQELAAAYTEETGVPVTVVTAASGEYETTLMAEMGKSEAPTLFQVNGPVGLKNWADSCYDLTGTDVLGQLTSDAFALKAEDGSVAGIGYVIESYGIIANKTLLAKAGYAVEDITSFADLKAVAEDITARQAELGFAAFSSAGMDGSSDWRFKTHLANLPIYFEYQADGINATDAIKGDYLDNYRAMWDLYINNSTCAPAELSAKTGDDSRNEFLAGEAVFFQNGSWEYSNLVGEGKFTDADLAMIPIYVGAGDEANQGLCTGTENYWCVNNAASEADIQATLDFMNWCVTSEVGTTAMCGGEGAMPSGANGMGFVIPFKAAKESANVFVKQDAEMTAAGKLPVSWNFTTMPSEEWKNGVGSALTAYAADQTDANWAAVVSAFVDGWATEYQLANS